MKSTSTVVPILLTTTTALFSTSAFCFEIHTEELLSHSILARLILESPSRRAIATRQKGAMAFLAEKAVVEEPAFLTEREVASGNEKQSSSDAVAETVVEEEGAEAEKKARQAPLAFGLAPL